MKFERFGVPDWRTIPTPTLRPLDFARGRLQRAEGWGNLERSEECERVGQPPRFCVTILWHSSTKPTNSALTPFFGLQLIPRSKTNV